MVPGEAIVLVATASAHRGAALEACAFLIDWLKTRAPFWKLEETPAGERWVARARDDDAAAARWAEPRGGRVSPARPCRAPRRRAARRVGSEQDLHDPHLIEESAVPVPLDAGA